MGARTLQAMTAKEVTQMLLNNEELFYFRCA